jgi:glycine cleavage system H protein
MNIPAELRYTKEHEWARLEGGSAVIGITDYAQGELGDIVFVELPAAGKKTAQMQSCASIEAVKAVSDLYAPLTGEVEDVNRDLEASPQLVNQDPYGKGWILKIKLENPAEWEKLLSPEDYGKLIG